MARIHNFGSAVLKYFGDCRTLVSCSKAKANLIKVGSLQALPKNVILTGSPRTKPAGTVIAGYPETAEGVELPPEK